MDMPSKLRNIADKIKSYLTDANNPTPMRERHPGDPWGDDEERRAILTVPAHGIVTFPEQLTQALAWPAQDLPPLNRAANTNTNATGGWLVGAVDMSRVYRAIAKLSIGAGTAANYVNAFFIAGNTTNSLQTITGAAWTWAAIANAATMNITNSLNTAQCTAEIRSDQLPANCRYLALQINNQCAQLFTAEIICAGGAYRPTSQYNCTATLGQSVT